MTAPPGKVLAIYIARRHGERLEPVDEAHASPGRGIEGDRHFAETGGLAADAELTLIESEAVAAAARELARELAPGDARRNVVTRDVDLNALVGRRFQVGEVLLEGMRLCHPCAHLESLTAPGVRRALAGRGGLRARILTAGTLRPGDPVRVLEAAPRGS